MPSLLTNIPWSAYYRLARIYKPAGIYLLLWPTLTALWLASEGLPDLKWIIIFSLGSFLMRAAGGVINDLTDQDIDAHVARTQDRPLAAKELSRKQAFKFFSFLVGLSLLLALQLNLYAIMLCGFSMVLTVIYPWMKRITYYPQVVLGLVWSLSILIVFANTQGQCPPVALWSFVANMMLTMAYDTMYALSDKEDDLKIGVKSTAIAFGAYVRPIIALFHLACLACWSYVGHLAELGMTYQVGLVGAGLFIGYQHKLIAGFQRDLCLKAFINHQWLVGYMFILTSSCLMF